METTSTTDTVYRHTQVGYVTLVVLGTVLGLAIAILWGVADGPVAIIRWVMIPILSLVLLTFSSLTIEIEDGVLQWYFGPGFWKQRVLVDDIAETHPVRNMAIMGWGIRFFGRGWLYNVSGLDAVEIKMESGKCFRLGTDEPDALQAALDAARGVE